MLTNGTELRLFVRTHTAILATSPDAFQQIAAPFVQTSLAFFDEVLPFDEGRRFGREIRLPRFSIIEVHGVVIAVSILITQTSERMAKFVYDYRQEIVAARIAEVIGIIDAAATIVFGIHKDDDMLVRCACQHVVETLQMKGCQIAIAVEGIEMRAEGCLLPDTFRGFTGADSSDTDFRAMIWKRSCNVLKGSWRKREPIAF